ncbi:hypothetical protein FQR65_LT05566 [Abscondita terminalis]|nr:hypothetical protein FQR65_LT05566 [Abscondita terminalis]
MPSDEEKPTIAQPHKSSMEILSELFSSFDAEPPVIIKKEKDDIKKHHKKAKKKHKKEKKHKKKDKKRKRSDTTSSQGLGVDLAQLLIEQERQSPEKKIKLEPLEHLENEVPKDDDINISIKDIKFSSILEAKMCKVSSEEVSEKNSSDVVEKHKKKKHKHKHEEKSKKKKKVRRSSSKERSNRHKSKEKSLETDWKNKDTCKRYEDKDKHRDRNGSREKDRFRDSSRDRDEKKFKYRDRSRSSEAYQHKHKDYYYYSDDKHEDKWFMRDRYRGYSELDKERERKHKGRSRSRDKDTHIDKKKLLEIARRNAIQMMKSGSLPGALTLGRQAQEKVLAAIRAGGKTIEELTDFCKTLSKKEELGELSSVSGEDGDSDNESRAFHHPFQIKDRPTGIVMNIKNSIPLPTKTAQERTTELRMQFPVSSGTQHRKTENEWIPVSPKKVETPPLPALTKQIVIPVAPPIPAESPPPLPVAQHRPQIFHELPDPNIDIGMIVSQRLTAMRKLQENPYDVEAINDMHKSQREMQSWAESKQQPGQFTGSTGAQILTQAELSSGYQAWARKVDFVHEYWWSVFVIISDLIGSTSECRTRMRWYGMHLLKKMGWNPGEGLGKEKTGALEPLLLEVKLDKKGLVANEEQKRKQQKLLKSAAKSLEGKHPVSLLGEYTAKKKLGAPQYTLCMESGPDHKKLFLFKVTVNGIEYKPDTASPNKKQAKADAAKLCLQQIGLLTVNGI